MNLTLSTQNFGMQDYDIEDPCSIWSFIASKIGMLPAPDLVTVRTPYGAAEFQIVKKGRTSFIKENYNNISIPDNGKPLKKVYLTCVNPEWNNYKFYQLEDMGNGNVLATYGRIGVGSGELFGERTHVYPKRMYWIKLMEKLNKGYKDQTDVYISNQSFSLPDKDENIPDTVSGRLYRLLRSFSMQAVSKSCISTKVTQAMVDQAKSLLSQLYQQTDSISEFNAVLLQLLAISPRRVFKVENMLAHSTESFKNIINREEDLLMAMEAVVSEDGTKPDEQPVKDIFADHDIEVFLATEKQKSEVLRHLSDSLHPLVKNVYRVIPKQQKARFEKYLKEHGKPVVKQFWHGSRNANWLSIIMNGLLLKPNAISIGKMLGNGIYFAPSSMKSWGYTSFRGSYWADGTEDTAFMGLYACAYGKPKDVVGPGWHDQSELTREGYHCIHAHAGSYLKNDEVVFYDEGAILLNYIIEFRK